MPEPSFFRVVANADSSLVITARLTPGANNDPIIAAAYAVLDELSGLNAVDPKDLPGPVEKGTA